METLSAKDEYATALLTFAQFGLGDKPNSDVLLIGNKDQRLAALEELS
ncbi:hypothetical protein TcasGA2_TC032360 [Tribolium castaneum]|uniref:Uncharacterized protein n=1 Tax=Tribolium castaneum TaxID=7070 RepID=A0A139WLY8_TRICA|nr:hypothetical protein TcasGA2_TC032360 [Tribolium castaneum]